MPDKDGENLASEETTPDTSLHGYKDHQEDVKGDLDKLNSGDPQQLQQKEVEDDEEPKGAPEKH